MDAVGIARQFTCYKDADDGNWITAMKEMSFHLRLDLLHCL